jgi:hypothetical protein
LSFTRLPLSAKLAGVRIGVGNETKPGAMENPWFEMYLNDRCQRSLSGWRRGIPVPSANRPERKLQGRPLIVRAALLMLLARPLAMTALGQEAIRMSMAGSAAAQGRETAAATPGYYNLQAGPTYWRFGASLGLAYNDNIDLVQSGQTGDFLYTPSLNAQLLWPVSQIQTLNLSIGAGYSGYVDHSSLNRAFVTPNSGLSFNIFAGDFLINLHDRFSISENNYQDPTVTASGGYSQFQNAVGIAVTWDLNKLVVNLGYDHSTGLELTGGEGQAGQSSDIFSAAAGLTLKPGMVLGIEAGGSLLNYSVATTNTPYTGGTQWNAGPYFKRVLTEYMTFSVDAGYVLNSPNANGSLPTAQEFGGYFVTVALTDRLNRFVQVNLNGGRNLSSTLFAGPTDTYSANLSANWNIIRKLTLVTSFAYQLGTQVGVAGGETFEQYGPNIQLSRPITKKLSSSLAYQFLERGANAAGQAYTLNVVTLGISYQF